MRTTACGFTNLGSITGSQRLAFYGPTLMVDIGFDPSYHASSKSPPNPSAKDVGALVDTGATSSCIDATLAMQLQLPIVNQVKVSGVHGAKMMNVHMAQVYVPSLPHLIWGAFIGADLTGGGQPHRAIIGRDFLRHFKMTYDGSSGLVTLEG
jgi:hypothetical protein